MANDLILTEDKHIMCSVAIAAVHFGVARKVLDEWIRNHQFPREKSKVDLANLMAARRESFEAQAKNASDAERKTKAEADLKEKQAAKAAIELAHMEGMVIFTDTVQDALTSLFAEIQGKCLASDNTSESDLLLLGVPQDTVNEYMRKRRERTNAMLTEFANGGESAFKAQGGAKPKRSYNKSKTGVSATTAGNRKRVGGS